MGRRSFQQIQRHNLRYICNGQLWSVVELDIIEHCPDEVCFTMEQILISPKQA